MMEVIVFFKSCTYLPDYTSSYPTKITSDEQRFCNLLLGRVLMKIIVYFDTEIPVSDLAVHITPSCYVTPNLGYEESLIDSAV